MHGLIYFVVLVAAFLLAYRDVKLSAAVSLVTESILISLVVLLGLITLALHGFRLDTAQLGLHGVSMSGVREGLVLASVSIVGLLFVFMASVQVLGFAGSGHSLTQSPAPRNSLAAIDGVPWLGRLIDAGLTIGIFAGVIGMLNAGSRMVFTMARDGILPARLGRVQPRFRTPSTALALVAAPAHAGS